MTVANRSPAPTVQNLPDNRSSMSLISRSATPTTPFGGFGLSCRVVKNKTLPFVRLEKEQPIVSPYSFRPLEDAVETAIVNLMEWMVTEYGVSERDAYMHACINPEFRINVYQMVRLGKVQYTAGAEILKKYLVPS